MVVNSKKNNSAFDFSKAKSELDQIIQTLREENTSLDLAVELYERGLKLTVDLEKYLKKMKNRIIEIKAKSQLD